MKRITTAALAAALIILLAACASDSYSIIHYETRQLMQDALGFEMPAIPDLESETSFGTADGKLGEVKYAFYDETLGECSVVLRMAELGYAEKYSSHSGHPGISALGANSELTEERIGSATVKYYASGKAAFAVWTLGEYSYYISVSYSDGAARAGHDQVYPYVLSIIAS